MSNEKKDKNKSIIFLVAIVILMVAGVLACRMFLREDKTGEAENNTVQPGIVEADGEDREDDGSDSNVSMKYSGYVTLYNDDRYMTMNFINPAKSKKSMSLEIIANVAGEDVVLATTEKIKPGYKIQKIETERKFAIVEGTYDGKYRVHFYNEEGGEEIVNSEIKIKVYVK